MYKLVIVLLSTDSGSRREFRGLSEKAPRRGRRRPAPRRATVGSSARSAEERGVRGAQPPEIFLKYASKFVWIIHYFLFICIANDMHFDIIDKLNSIEILK